MIIKRKDRKYSLQAIYSIDLLFDLNGLTQKKNKPLLDVENNKFINNFINNIFIYFEMNKDHLEKTIYIVDGVINNIKQIDNVISDNIIKWRIERLLMIDLSILRLATYELLFFKNFNIGLILNEAIEISKKFSGKDSANFINGVLDAISRDIRDTDK